MKKLAIGFLTLAFLLTQSAFAKVSYKRWRLAGTHSYSMVNWLGEMRLLGLDHMAHLEFARNLGQWEIGGHINFSSVPFHPYIAYNIMSNTNNHSVVPYVSLGLDLEKQALFSHIGLRWFNSKRVGIEPFIGLTFGLDVSVDVATGFKVSVYY